MRLSFALPAKTILKLFPELLNGWIFTLVHTTSFFLYEQILELTFKVFHFRLLGLFVHNLQRSLLNCAPCAPSCLLALPIIDTCLPAYVLYQSLIRACVLLLSPLSPLTSFLGLVLCCFNCKVQLKT